MKCYVHKFQKASIYNSKRSLHLYGYRKFFSDCTPVRKDPDEFDSLLKFETGLKNPLIFHRSDRSIRKDIFLEIMLHEKSRTQNVNNELVQEHFFQEKN